MGPLHRRCAPSFLRGRATGRAIIALLRLWLATRCYEDVLASHRRAFCRQNELKQLSAVQDWQKERLTGVDITDGAPMELPPAPREPGDDRR